MIKKILILIILLLSIDANAQFIPFPFLSGNSTLRSAQVFYVKSTGNNSLSGLDTTNAWQSLDKLSSLYFVPGDTIRFKGSDTIKGGAIINNLFSFNTTSNKVVFNSYGTGKSILLIGDTNTNIIRINFQVTERFEFKKLIFKGKYDGITKTGGASTSNGIYVYNLYQTNITGGDSNLVLVDSCDFTKLKNSGVTLSYFSYYKRGRYWITNNSFSEMGANGISIYGIVYSNFLIKYNSFTNIRGLYNTGTTNPLGTAIGAQYCRNVTVERNYINGATIGVYFMGSRNIKYRHNEVRNIYREATVPNVFYPEGNGLYFDCGTDSSLMEYNYIQNCQGSGIVLTNSPTSICGYPTTFGLMLGFVEDSLQASFNIARFNIIKVDSGGRSAVDLGFGGYNTQFPKRSMVYNNLFYVKKGRKIGWETTNDTIYNRLFPPTGIDEYLRNDSVYIYNNIFVLDSAIALRLDTVISTAGNGFGIRNATIKNNIYWNVRGTSTASMFEQRTNKFIFYANPPGDPIFYYLYKTYTSIKNWSDSTGFESNNSYINYNPYIKNIRAINNIINYNFLDSLANFKNLDISFAKNNGINYNSEVRRIADTATTDFYGNALSSSAICIGQFNDVTSYTFQSATQRWFGRDTALSTATYISQDRRRLCDTAIVKQLKDNSIWDTLKVAYLFANEKVYFTTLNIKSDTGNATFFNSNNFTFKVDTGLAMTNNYLNSNYNLRNSTLTLTNLGGDVYSLEDDISGTDDNNEFGIKYDNLSDSLSIFSINVLGKTSGATEYFVADDLDDQTGFGIGNSLGMFSIERYNSLGINLKEFYQNGVSYGIQIVDPTFIPNGNIYIFATNDIINSQAINFSNRRLSWVVPARGRMTAGKNAQYNLIINAYMNYLNIDVE